MKHPANGTNVKSTPSASMPTNQMIANEIRATWNGFICIMKRSARSQRQIRRGRVGRDAIFRKFCRLQIIIRWISRCGLTFMDVPRYIINYARTQRYWTTEDGIVIFPFSRRWLIHIHEYYSIPYTRFFFPRLEK